ncbi:MAG: hypothetical protein GC165_12865 [Armatimonadetes bacterium]|nr:hypothetical protein [Armatimonadota bacterium]
MDKDLGMKMNSRPFANSETAQLARFRASYPHLALDPQLGSLFVEVHGLAENKVAEIRSSGLGGKEHLIIFDLVRLLKARLGEQADVRSWLPLVHVYRDHLEQEGIIELCQMEHWFDDNALEMEVITSWQVAIFALNEQPLGWAFRMANAYPVRLDPSITIPGDTILVLSVCWYLASLSPRRNFFLSTSDCSAIIFGWKGRRLYQALQYLIDAKFIRVVAEGEPRSKARTLYMPVRSRKFMPPVCKLRFNRTSSKKTK